MPQRIRLLATCQVNGSVHSAGEVITLPDGQRGPHRTVVASNHGAAIGDASAQILIDQPLFVVLDETIENEREEMRVRHAEERNALDHVDDRTVLSRKQGQEAAALEQRAAESELKQRQDNENKGLKDRQAAETAAFDKRAETPALVTAPVELSKEDLDKRHASEAEALEKRHTEEARGLESRKRGPGAAPASAPDETSVADMRSRHAGERESLSEKNDRDLANATGPDRGPLAYKQRREMEALVSRQEDEISALELSINQERSPSLRAPARASYETPGRP